MSAEAEDRNLYSMRVVARLTGLSPDTIRKWEQRYGAIEPLRTAGNTRKFATEHIQRLNLLRQVTAGGHTIKDVARLPDDRLRELLLETERGPQPADEDGLPAPADAHADLRRRYLDHIRAYQVHQASDLLARSALVLKPGDFVYQMVLPILRQTGELWQHGKASVAQEHLVSAQMRGLLINMRHWTAPQPGAARIVIATPEDHLHEFGALVGAILVGSRGFDPIYLGPAVPASDICEAIERAKADLLLLSVVRDISAAERERLITDLRQLASRVETWLGLPADHTLVSAGTGARLFHDFEALDMALTQRATAAGR